ncbi:MAG TPA: hypothetical protein VHY56_14875 [Candidatus Binataceae bacterium]|nr:hypothetical protein [Candidatus Binataceae bacterium]
MNNSSKFAVGILALSLALPLAAGAQDSSGVGTNPQVPQPDQSAGVNWKGVGVGAGTLVGNVFYMPAKLLYGLGGGLVGGAGYVLTGGNKQVSDTIWRSSLGGDYVLTPDMVAGKQPVHFSGPTDTAPQASANDNGRTVANTGYPTSSSLPPAGPAANSTSHPIDNGAGPVGNGASSRRPPDTSIE